MEAGTGSGTRTHTGLRPADFESAASSIPPSRRRAMVSNGSGYQNAGFGDSRRKSTTQSGNLVIGEWLQ